MVNMQHSRSALRAAFFACLVLWVVGGCSYDLSEDGGASTQAQGIRDGRPASEDGLDEREVNMRAAVAVDPDAAVAVDPDAGVAADGDAPARPPFGGQAQGEATDAGEEETADVADPMASGDMVNPPAADCGNGVVEGDEECDDGNDNPFDTCSFECELQTVAQACEYLLGDDDYWSYAPFTCTRCICLSYADDVFACFFDDDLSRCIRFEDATYLPSGSCGSYCDE